MRRQEPVRLQKKPEKKPLIENGLICGIPIEFVLMTIIMSAIFGLIIALMGPTTDSGLWYNMPHV